MENTNSIKEIIRNSLEEVRSILDADTIMGQPVKLDNGTTIIPISKVSMGFASGGLDLPDQENAGGLRNFGGGGGTGVTVYPIGFLTSFPDGRVEILPLKQEFASPLEQIVDLINRAPSIIDRLRDAISGKSGVSDAERVPLTERVLRKLQEDEESEDEDDPERSEKRHLTREEKEALKEARRKEAEEQELAERAEKRRRESFDLADEE